MQISKQYVALFTKFKNMKAMFYNNYWHVHISKCIKIGLTNKL